MTYKYFSIYWVKIAPPLQFAKTKFMQRKPSLNMFAKPHSQPFHHSSAADDDSAATILRDPAEVARRRPGRPPGSKNKPKPVAVVSGAARDVDPAMIPYVLEVPGGSDVVEAISRFCRRMNRRLCIHNAYGSVADVTLRHPPPSPVASLTLRGRFDIVSVSATFLPPTTSFSIPNELIVNLAGPQGLIFGGSVTEGLIGVGNVYVIAGSFINRFPSEDEIRNLGSGDDEEHQLPPISGQNAADSGGLLPTYGTHSSSAAKLLPRRRQY